MSTWNDLKDNPRLMNIYRTRLQIVRLIREFFWSEFFIEAETPLAVRFPGQEPYLNPLPITIHDAAGKANNFYLHTSPEFSLKKLLAAGFNRIFEITKTFRDHEDLRGSHSPEFTMMEWYRSPGSYTDFMNDLENLFKFVGKSLNQTSVHYKNLEIPINDKWDRFSVKELWQKYVGVNLDEYLTLETITTLARARGYEVTPDFAYEDVFFKIFLNDIEPHLGKERPVFVYDYPAQLCSLSRRCASDPRYGERAECYIGGLELCNGFGELTDPVEQSKRLEEDRALRQKLGKATWPVDPSFIAALRSGIAPAGGVALGVDRMVLLFTEAKDINEVIFNSLYDQLSVEP